MKGIHKMRIMVLAGGFDQIALIQKLKNRGHEVVLIDYYKNPLAKGFSDFHYQVSTLDIDAVLKCAKNEKVDLVTTACTDQALLTAATVSEELGLPFYISARTAQKVTNKAYMKEMFKANGISSAKHIVFDCSTKITEWKGEHLDYPLVIKPCDCNSSKGVVKVWSEKDLPSAVENAFSLSRSKKVIAESFINGQEISIDAWIDNEGTKIISVSSTKKIRSNENEFTIFQSSYPIKASVELENKIQETADRIAKAFDLHKCPLLIQAIINENNIYVIEFSARMGGGSKYKLIEYMSGIDIMQVYVNRILGDENQIIVPRKSDKFIELDYVYAYNGVFSHLKNFEELKNEGIIKELFIYKTRGEIIYNKVTSSDRIAGILLEENSQDELIKTREIILNQVDIIDENGKSLMYKECFKK